MKANTPGLMIGGAALASVVLYMLMSRAGEKDANTIQRTADARTMPAQTATVNEKKDMNVEAREIKATRVSLAEHEGRRPEGEAR